MVEQKEKKKNTPRREEPDRHSSVTFTVAFLKPTLCLIPALCKAQNGDLL